MNKCTAPCSNLYKAMTKHVIRLHGSMQVATVTSITDNFSGPDRATGSVRVCSDNNF